MSSRRHASEWLFAASLVSVLVLVICGVGFLFPGRYQDEDGIPPTTRPYSRQHITTVQFKRLAELRAERLAVIKAHLATLDGASTLSEKPGSIQPDLREYTFTVEFQKQLNQIHLTGTFVVCADNSQVTLPSHYLRVTSLHYFIGVQSSAERMQLWIHELSRQLKEWDSAIEQTVMRKEEATEP